MIDVLKQTSPVAVPLYPNPIPLKNFPFLAMPSLKTLPFEHLGQLPKNSGKSRLNLLTI